MEDKIEMLAYFSTGLGIGALLYISRNPDKTIGRLRKKLQEDQDK